MCGREWFMVGARLLGLWVLYSGLAHASVVLEHMLDLEPPGSLRPGYFLLHACWHLGLAGILLFKTPALAGLMCGSGDVASAAPDGQPPEVPDANRGT